MSRYIDIEPYEKDGWYLQKHYHNSYGEVIKTTPLVSVPTADAEPVKHGRWVESWGGKWHSCSVCGGIPPFNFKGEDLPTDYCPHCGAKMDLTE